MRSSSPPDRARAAIVAACSAALFAPLLYPVLTGRVFVYNDLSWFHLPLRHLFQQALQSHDSVLWTPAVFSGLYVHGEGQLGLFHPMHQLLYRLLPLAVALNLELIVNYAAAFAGMFVLLRRLRFDHAASLFGAMLFAFSGFNLLHHHHVNMIAIVAHLPWLLAAADFLIGADRRRERALALAAVAAILGSEFLLGFPQAVWWNALTLGAFALFRGGETGRWSRLFLCGIAVAIGTLLGGVQLVSSADAVAHSMRAGVPREFALTYSMHPFNLFQIWSPYFFARGGYSETDYMWFHEFGIYSGAILTLAPIWVWSRGRALADRRGLIVAATVFGAIMLLLALGRYGPFGVLLTHVPVLRSLRASVRYIVLVQFAMTILAAVVFEDLSAIADGHRQPASLRMPAMWIPALLGLATTLALNTGLLGLGRLTFAKTDVAVPGVIVIAVVTMLIVRASRRARWGLAAVVVVTAVDLAAWGMRYVYRDPPRPLDSLTAGIEAAPATLADTYAAAPLGGRFGGDLLVLRGYRLASGYAGLMPAAQHPVNSDAALRLGGARWSFSHDAVRQPFPGGADRARLVDDTGSASTEGVRVPVDRPGHLRVDVDSPGGRTLALTERFHEGWSVTIDGTRSDTLRVEEDFLGCAVPAGVHRVEFRFAPRSFFYGSIVSLVGAALLAGVVAVGLLRS